MEKNSFTEKDSLELISQMIQQSKKNMEIGSGNILLYYGYPAVILAVEIYLLVHMTHNRTNDLYTTCCFCSCNLYACFIDN
jgi:hypothetical protein